MRKALKISGIIFIILLAGGVVFWYYLPDIMVSAIRNDWGNKFIPPSVRTTINKKVDELPGVLQTLEAQGIHITIDDIIKEINESTEEEITRTIAILENTELKSTDQVINIVLNNMDFGKLEDEKVVAVAKQKMKMSDIKKAMKMIRENGKPYAATIPLGKETIKGLLLEKQKEIEKQINS